MNRSDLVTEMAARFDQLSQSDTEMAVTTLLEAMGTAIARGHRIEIRGFGAFSVKKKAPRMGRNPRNGDSVAVPERRVAHFKPGKELREKVNAALANCGPLTLNAAFGCLNKTGDPPALPG